MANYISQVRQNFLDGNLGINSNDVKFNKSIFVVGSASKGPVSTPVRINDLKEIEEIFGSYGVSPLSVKLREAWLATTDIVGVRRIYGVRLSGGQYASLEIPEATLSNTAYTQPGVAPYSLKLTGKYPGSLPVTIKSAIVNGKTSIVLYNPDTGLETIIPYDATNPLNTAVPVHTVSELVNAINNDPNISAVIVAEYPELEALYELSTSNSGYGISVVDGYTTLTLTNIPADDDDNITGAADTIYTGQEAKKNVQGENLIKNVRRVYELSIVKQQLIDGAGYREFNLTKTPINPSGEKIISFDGTTTTVSEYKQTLRQALMGTVTYTGNLIYSIPLYLAPDVFDNTIKTTWESLTGTSSSYVGAKHVTGWTPDWEDVSTATSTDEDHIILYFKHNDSINPIPRDKYIVTWDASDTSNPLLKVTIDSEYMQTNISVGDYIMVDVDTVIGRLVPVSSYNAISNATAFYYYFISGNKITFGAPLPSSIRITYQYVRDYTLNENVILESSFTGKFRWTDTTYTLGSIGDPEVIRPSGGTGLGLLTVHPLKKQGYTTLIPQCEVMDAGIANPNYRLIHRDNNNGTAFTRTNIIVGFNYTYEPEWPEITAVTQVLQGGTSGINLSNADKYYELSSTLSKLEQYQPDVIVLSDLYLDDVKLVNNPITGLLEEVNAGFHVLLNDFVKTQSAESRPCIGLISVKNPINYSPEAVNNWIEKLTIIDSKEPTRAANIKYTFKDLDPKFIGVVAMPLIKSINGVTYITTGETTLAAMYSALPANEALNHKPISNIVGVPYNLTRSQSDILAQNTYITYMYSSPFGYVVADDPTVLGLASDYNTLSVVGSMQDLTAAVRDVLVTFLGKRYNEAMKNAMQSAVNRVIMEKKMEESIVDAKAVINATPQMQRLGSVNCQLIVRPAFGIKTITIDVKAAIII